jgi:hypothetical protein
MSSVPVPVPETVMPDWPTAEGERALCQRSATPPPPPPTDDAGLRQGAVILARFMHEGCRSKFKPLILPREVADANFVEFSATRFSARPSPWPQPASGHPGA